MRKRKEDKNELFKSLEFKIGIERDEFDTTYDDFKKMCPKDLNFCSYTTAFVYKTFMQDFIFITKTI